MTTTDVHLQLEELDALEHHARQGLADQAAVSLDQERFARLVALARHGLEVDAGEIQEAGMPGGRLHCDSYIHDRRAPLCLRVWILAHRMPAVDCLLLREAGIQPALYADHEGRRVRVVMASRFGDVGVTSRLDAEYGYERRVTLDQLSNFGAVP